MANVFSPQGFSVVGRADGAAWSGNATTYQILNTNTHKLFAGDVVVLLSSGYIDTLAPGTTPPLGIFVGCYYVSISQSKLIWSPYYPGADALNNPSALVIDDPNVLLVAQSGWSSGNAAAVGIASVGQNVNFANGSGNAMNGLSTAYVDAFTIATTATLPFRIMPLNIDDSQSGNGSDPTTAYNNLLLAWNNHFYKQLTGI